MDDPNTVATQLTGLSQQQQIYVVLGIQLLGMVGKFLGALGTAGGLKNILLRAWKGQAVPAAIAEDYKTELKAEKVPVAMPPKTDTP